MQHPERVASCRCREFNEGLGGVVGGPLGGYEDVPSSMTTVAEDARRSDPTGKHPESEEMSDGEGSSDCGGADWGVVADRAFRPTAALGTLGCRLRNKEALS
jgi:hypothetical protein